MKKAEQIMEDAIKKAEKDKMPHPYYFATGALKAEYDILRRDYLELKKELLKLQKK